MSLSANRRSSLKSQTLIRKVEVSGPVVVGTLVGMETDVVAEVVRPVLNKVYVVFDDSVAILHVELFIRLDEAVESEDANP